MGARILSFIHSFILNIYIAPHQENYSENSLISAAEEDIELNFVLLIIN